ncbi:MAG TPA: hypothetical protein VEK73_22045 [Xanthobacteraceae bacterium]|nr:hypothetical protein [Xanthobacteraceae bacterium]
MVPITGTVVAIGSRATTDGDTTFQYLAIRERGGSPRHLTIVRASAEVAALIEPHVIGTFLFQEGQGERRLCYVYRADGPRQVDFEALQRCFVGG